MNGERAYSTSTCGGGASIDGQETPTKDGFIDMPDSCACDKDGSDTTMVP